jgi:hypothetical protein
MEFASAFFAIGFAVFLWIAQPGSIGPMFRNGTAEAAIAVVAIVGVSVGLVWMIRIYRANPEPDQRAWRYRDRD